MGSKGQGHDKDTNKYQMVKFASDKISWGGAGTTSGPRVPICWKI